MIRTVLELDLAGYADIAVALEEALDVHAVRKFEDQIQTFVKDGLTALGLERSQVMLGAAGDNAILQFESAEQMHLFAATVQEECRKYNADKTTPLAQRWFRMGAATGTVEFDQENRRIIGTTVTRAVRLEAASEKGTMLIDQATFAALPPSIQNKYGPPHTISGKREERYTAYQIRFIEEQLIDKKIKGGPFLNQRIVLTAVTLLAFFVLGSIFYSCQRHPDNPMPTETSLEVIRGQAEVRVFSTLTPDRNDRSIDYPGMLPLRSTEDQIRLEVRLKKPAYVYLLWIGPSGEVTPVYPWKPGDWTTVSNQKPVAHVVYPTDEYDPIPMKGNVEGREVFLALARSTPLPPDVNLKEIISRCSVKLPIKDFKVIVRFRNREVEATIGQDRDPEFLLPNPSDDPFRQMAAKLKQELSPHFDFVDGAAFASQIRPK